MEIKLVKNEEQDFKIDESKCKKFNFNDIMFLSGVNYTPTVSELPRYVAFKTREEFFANMNNYDIDTTKDVLINSKGYFFCPIKNTASIVESKETVNEPADTKENNEE